MSRLGLVTFVAREYDEAIGFFVGKLDFELVEDTDMGEGKRWVVVVPASGLNSGASLLIARAVTDSEKASVGNQAGGRVAFFLNTDNFDRDLVGLRGQVS
jgi:catechol 2,3-dioxygenase-like lactoylglutathione lyase family enzyme